MYAQLKNVKVTPMLKQWMEAKEKAQDAILLFRMGDFYELFAQDAETAAPVLDLTLTSRDKDKGDQAIAMAGFPHQAAPQYIAKLIAAGFKVAVCDQMEDPQTAKGIVKRDITRIVTPGTALEENVLTSSQHNFLVGVYCSHILGIAALDVSTGDFYATTGRSLPDVLEEIQRICPSEMLLCGEPESVATFQTEMKSGFERFKSIRVEVRRHAKSDKLVQQLPALDGWFSSKDQEPALWASNMLLEYVLQMQGIVPSHIHTIRPYSIDSQLLLDATTRQHLDISRLLKIIDKTRTAMGARLLSRFVTSPSSNLEEIESRHHHVELLLQRPEIRNALKHSLKHVYDIERLTARIASKRSTPRDLKSLLQSLHQVPSIKDTLLFSGESLWASYAKNLDSLQDVVELLQHALVENPPTHLRDGGVFQIGYDAILDDLIALSDGGREQIAAIERRERENTGIPTLKVGYTRVFGYYIEVTKTHLAKVPEHFKRKQTVATGERFVTEELSRLEEQISSAETKRLARETFLFAQLVDQLQEKVQRLKTLAHQLARLDVFNALAQVADENRYIKPTMFPKERKYLSLKQSRHPIVESVQSAKGQFFVPNDILLQSENRQLVLMTGPNMGGKSTIMRQVALAQILAQAGSFVPATQATMSICDRIFTRVGASDDMVSGRSTFMVEMSETAQILKNATPYSLVLLDEIGRGTSTFDGLSIAWSVAEYLHDYVGARALFATHYHELTQIANSCARVVNQHVAVQERNQQITFLYVLQDGAAEQSYGVHVARLAGLPSWVLTRAEQILAGLENSKLPKKLVQANQIPPKTQLELFS